jgi:hypothetical protein
MMVTPVDSYNQIRLEEVKKALEANFFEATIHQTLTEAQDYIINKIVPGHSSVGFGGSTTLASSGLLEKLKAISNLKVIDRNDTSQPPEIRQELSRQTLLTDLFIASSNAVTSDGELVNIDKFGNRVAAIAFGPKKVALLVGRNKITADTHAGIYRVKNVAAPINALRLNTQTPCAKTGKCHNCKSQTRLCGVTVITQRSFPPGRIHVLLINQDLGF